MWHQAYIIKQAMKAKQTPTQTTPEPPYALPAAGLAAGGAITGAGLALRPIANAGSEMIEAGDIAKKLLNSKVRNRQDLMAELPGRYIMGGHKAMNTNIAGVSPETVLNTVLNKPSRALRIGPFKSPGHYKFVQDHYGDFKESPRKALSIMLNEAYHFNAAKSPHQTFNHILADYDELTKILPPKEAVSSLFKNPEYSRVLRHIMADKIPWAMAYGRALRAAKAVPYIGGAALLGSGALLAHRMAKESKAKDQQPGAASTLATGAAAGTGAGLLAHGLRRAINPANEVGFTYGTQPWMGAGHKAPGEALSALLARDPEFKKFKFTQLPMATYNVPEDYVKKDLLAMVDSGFGATLNTPTVNFLTDLPHSQEQARDLQTFRHAGNAGRDVVTYGNERAIPTHMGEPGQAGVARTGQNFRVGGVSPALNPGVRDMLTGNANSRTPLPVEKYEYNRLLTTLKDSAGRPVPIPRKLIEGKKIIAVSGSGRGDLVGERARQVAEHLKATGRNDVVVLALGAGGHQEAQELTAGLDNVINLPKLPQKEFVNVLRGADLHYGSSGASSFAESMGSGNKFVLPESWGQFESEVANPMRQRLGKPIIEGNASKAWLDRVNAGTLQYAKEHGVPRINPHTPQQIVDLLDKPDVGKAAIGNTQNYLRNTDLSQLRFKQYMKDFLTRAQRTQRMKGVATAAAGVPLAYLGVRSLLRHMHKQKRDVKAASYNAIKPTTPTGAKGILSFIGRHRALRSVGVGAGIGALSALALRNPKKESDLDKKAGLLTGLAARAADTVLSPLVRRSGLFKNYYSSLARTGFLHGLEGTQQLAPRVRPFIGALSPSLSGLTD